MILTKKRKKILLIALPAAVVVIAAAAVVVVLLLNRSSSATPWQLQDISQYNGTGETEYAIAGGLESNADLPQPMPFYAFTPPEGYTHTEDARETANRYSTHYYDEYKTSDGEKIISLTQQPAFVSWRYSAEGSYQEVQFGDTKVVCRTGEQDATAIWIHDQTLLILFVNQPLDENQLLELVSRMDYENLCQPIYSPWEFHWGSYAETVVDRDGEEIVQTSSQYYEITGNPQLPEQIQYYGFAQPPEGFELNQRLTELNSQEGFWMEFYTGEDAEFDLCTRVTGTQVFGDIRREDLNNHDLVQEITVQGHQGWYHQSDTGAKLVFITDYLIVEMNYQGEITQEEMLALAEGLVEKPIEEAFSERE